MTLVLVEVAGRVATVTLNRPEALNAISTELALALAEAFEPLATDPGVRAVVLTGAGEAPSGTVRATVGSTSVSAGKLLTSTTSEEVGMLLTVLGAMRAVGPDAVPPAPWTIELLESIEGEKD